DAGEELDDDVGESGRGLDFAADESAESDGWVEVAAGDGGGGADHDGDGKAVGEGDPYQVVLNTLCFADGDGAGAGGAEGEGDNELGDQWFKFGHVGWFLLGGVAGDGGSQSPKTSADMGVFHHRGVAYRHQAAGAECG